MKHKTFKTQRLFLRPTNTEDAAFILELLNSPKWLIHIGDRKVKTLEDAKSYIETKMLPQLKKLGYSNYTAIRKSDHVKVGSCGLYNREGVDGVDIGYALLPQYEKQGYAFEAASAVKEAAFKDFGLKSVSAYTTKENVASQTLLKKLGLELMGTTFIPNDDEELLLFKLEI